MYVTDKYVFIHHNKNAGVFVKDYMLKRFKDCKIKVYKHAPIRCLPEADRNKIKIGVVRNPFDWYVSFYHYHQANGWYTKVGFSEYVKTHLSNSRQLISKAQKKNVIDKSAKIRPPKAKYMDIGSCTFHYINFFCFDSWDVLRTWRDYDLKENFKNICDLDVVMRTERLRKDMAKLFKDKSIINLSKKNTSTHRHYREYYDPELRKLVEKKDGILMKHYGYKFY